MGPSHYQYIHNVAVSKASECQTPMGNLIVDTEITDKLCTSVKNMWWSLEIF